MWEPRRSSSAERVYSEVEYIASEGDSYLDFDLSVHYEPVNSRNGTAARSLFVDWSEEVEEVEEVSSSAPPSWCWSRTRVRFACGSLKVPTIFCPAVADITDDALFGT